MTLVITVLSHHGLWQSTDHQLTRGGEALPDSSVKNTYLEAEDGKAMIAYAGVGKVNDMQISEWVRGVLRGKKRNLVDHLSVLRDAANRKLLAKSKESRTPHTFSVAAYKNGQPTLYMITNRVIQDGKHIIGDKFDWRCLVLSDTQYRFVINVEGQGALALSKTEGRDLITKTIRRRIARPSLGKDVGAVLARLNAKASNDQRSEGKVSQNCMVTYLASSTDGVVTWFFGWDPSVKKPMLQDVAGGFDVTNIVETIAPFSLDYLTRQLEALKKGEPFNEQLDIDALNEGLRRNHKEPSDEFK